MARTQQDALALPALFTARLQLVHAAPAMAGQHARFFERNRDFFAPWDPPRPGGLHTAAYWKRQLQQAVVDFHAGASVRFAMFERDLRSTDPGAIDPEAPLVGRINFTQVVRGWFQSCMLGYQVDQAHEGRGLMREGIAAATDYLFGTLRLHRIQANYRPENERSARLLERLGFVKEGYARNYLFIDGAWRDHVLTALVATAEPAPPTLQG
jgi:ribosomal-protein-alanine N-acetyltransferase